MADVAPPIEELRQDRDIGAVLDVRDSVSRILIDHRFDLCSDVYTSHYISHTPGYTVVDAQGLVEALKSGLVAYDQVDYTVEYAARHAPDMIVLMGVETVVPSAGRPNSGAPVARRYSDIYRHEAGAWRHDVRHAHTVDPAPEDLAEPDAPPIRIHDGPDVAAVLDYRRRTFEALEAGTARDPTGRYSSNFIANTPMGTIVSGDEMRQIFSSGSVGYGRVTQAVEYARAHTPDMAVVMGGEVVVPRGDAPNAGMNIHRRFTDIFRREEGEWRHDLRHANVVRID
jgi:hypothetical protein